MIAYNLNDPKKLAFVCAIGSFTVSFGFYILNKLGVFDAYPKFYWMSACAFLLIYSIFNSVISLRVENSPNYWGSSIMMFVSLAGLSGLLAYFLSGIGIYDAGSYSFIYVVVTFGYLVFISIMNFVKKIVDFAQKEVWLHPKLRNKK
jgi:hypothetical protein